MTAVKTPEERGPLGWWAYETRAVRLGLSPEQVVERLGSYSTSTLRKAEGDGRKNMSRPLWRALTSLYASVAAEQNVVLDPLPVPGEPEPSGDMAALVAAIASLVEEMRETRREQAAWTKGVTDAVALLAGQRDAGPTDDPEPQPLEAARR